MSHLSAGRGGQHPDNFVPTTPPNRAVVGRSVADEAHRAADTVAPKQHLRPAVEVPPEYPVPDFGSIPTLLKGLPRWVLWVSELRGGKWTKVPYTVEGNRANSIDPSTWSTYEEIKGAFEYGVACAAGVGFVLTKEDRVIGYFDAERTSLTLLYVAEAPEGVRERTWAPLVSEAWPGLKPGGVRDTDDREHPIYESQVWESTKAQPIEAFDDDVRALADAGFSVRMVIRFGDPAQEIADLIEEDDIDAVVMATHGRSGLSRAIMGSVAERVLRMVHVPVIMIRGRDDTSTPAFTPLG